MILDYQKAKEELLAGKLEDCQQFFAKNGYMLEEAYARLLSNDIAGAKVLFSFIKRFLIVPDSIMPSISILFRVSILLFLIKSGC